MKIVVDDIPPEGLDWKSSEEGNSFLTEEGLSFLSLVRVDVKLTRERKKVLLSGRVEAELELACSRCLEPCRHSLSFQLELIYYPLPPQTGGDKKLKEEDFLVSYYQEGTIDIREDIREALILAFPPKPLCHPECRGLCPHCGRNLNKEVCVCHREQIDPRLAKLRELLKKSEVSS